MISDTQIEEYVQASQIMSCMDVQLFYDNNRLNIRKHIKSLFQEMNSDEKQLLIERLNEKLKIYNIRNSIPETTITSICDKCDYYVVDKTENYNGAYTRIYDSFGPGCIMCNYKDVCFRSQESAPSFF
jgi:hypothetical protein